MAEKKYDVFLSHNRNDKPAVRQLAEALKKRGLTPWLDEEQLVPGRPWQEALEDVIETAISAAVLVAKDGMGPWQHREMRACLEQLVERGLPVIPVLLPGAPAEPELPLFLRGVIWVNLRGGLTKEGLDRLQWGITGKKKQQEPAGGHLFEGPAEAPARRVKHFQDVALDELRKKLSSNAEAVCVVAAGIGGIGKTMLARQFVATEAPTMFPEGAAWLNGTNLIAELRRVAERFGLQDAGRHSAEQAVAFLCRALHDRPVLLVIDNVDPAQVDLRHLPIAGGKSRTLITSRAVHLADELDDEAISLRLNVWPRESIYPPDRTW